MKKINHWNELKKSLRTHEKFKEAVKDAQDLKDMYPEESKGITAENMITARIVLCTLLEGDGFKKEHEESTLDLDVLAEELRANSRT